MTESQQSEADRLLGEFTIPPVESDGRNRCVQLEQKITFLRLLELLGHKHAKIKELRRKHEIERHDIRRWALQAESEVPEERERLNQLLQRLDLPPFVSGRNRIFSRTQKRTVVAIAGILRKRKDGSLEKFCVRHGLYRDTVLRWERELQSSEEEYHRLKSKEYRLRGKINFPEKIEGRTRVIPNEQRVIVVQLADILAGRQDGSVQKLLSEIGIGDTLLSKWRRKVTSEEYVLKEKRLRRLKKSLPPHPANPGDFVPTGSQKKVIAEIGSILADHHDGSVRNLCLSYGIDPNQIYRWQRQYDSAEPTSHIDSLFSGGLNELISLSLYGDETYRAGSPQRKEILAWRAANGRPLHHRNDSMHFAGTESQYIPEGIFINAMTSLRITE